MNYKDIIFLDFETTGKNPHTCQPIELGAVVIDGRKMEIREGEQFESYIRPELDDTKCAELGLDPLTDECLKITNIKREDVENAADAKTVWNHFSDFVNKFNPKKDNWKAPIAAGFNIDGYDMHIINRLCGGHFWQTQLYADKIKAAGIKLNEPYGFGPWDEKRLEQKLFSKLVQVDLMDIVWLWSENMVAMDSISMAATREWLGIEKDGAHRAIKDVMDGAETLIRFMKLKRNVGPKVNFRRKA